MKFIVDIYLDGFEDERKMKRACKVFLEENLDFSGSSVSVEELDDSYVMSLEKAAKDVVEYIHNNPDVEEIMCCCDLGGRSVGLSPTLCEYHALRRVLGDDE